MGDRATVYMLRTTDAEGRSYGGFCWPREVGAVVTAQDWSPEPVCGLVVRPPGRAVVGRGGRCGVGGGSGRQGEGATGDCAPGGDARGRGGVAHGARPRPRDVLRARHGRRPWHRDGRRPWHRDGRRPWHRDGRRYRLVVGYVGENGIEAGVPYRLDADGRFVRAEAQR